MEWCGVEWRSALPTELSLRSVRARCGVALGTRRVRLCKLTQQLYSWTQPASIVSLPARVGVLALRLVDAERRGGPSASLRTWRARLVGGGTSSYDNKPRHARLDGEGASSYGGNRRCTSLRKWRARLVDAERRGRQSASLRAWRARLVGRGGGSERLTGRRSWLPRPRLIEREGGSERLTERRS